MKRFILLLTAVLAFDVPLLAEFWPHYVPKTVQLINKSGKALFLNVCIPCTHGGLLTGEKMPIFDIAPHYDLQSFDLQAWFEKELKNRAAFERCLLPQEEEFAWDVASSRLATATGVMVFLTASFMLMVARKLSANPHIMPALHDNTLAAGAVFGTSFFTGLAALYFFTFAKKGYLELPARMGIQIIDPSKTICKTYLSDDSMDHTCAMVDCIKSPDKTVDTGFVEIAPGFGGGHKYIIKVIQGALRLVDQRGQILQPLVPR